MKEKLKILKMFETMRNTMLLKLWYILLHSSTYTLMPFTSIERNDMRRQIIAINLNVDPEIKESYSFLLQMQVLTTKCQISFQERNSYGRGLQWRRHNVQLREIYMIKYLIFYIFCQQCFLKTLHSCKYLKERVREHDG